MPQTRQTFAFSGVFDNAPGRTPSFALIEHTLNLVKTQRPTRPCYIATAVGDNPRAIDHYRNLMAVWRATTSPKSSLCAFTYRSMIADRTIPAGYAGEDGGLHYIETDLYEAVSIREGNHAWWVEPSEGGGDAEKSIEARLI